MNSRARWLALGIVALIVLGAAAVYGVNAFLSYQRGQAASSSVDSTIAKGVTADGPRIVFRNTAAGDGYGLVASVPLADHSGARTLSSLSCDRVYATERYLSCLRTQRGIVTTFEAVLYTASGDEVKTSPLPGVPSRTRISADSRLVASTAFVTGMSYATVGFSTQTTLSTTDGVDYGNLEGFTTLIDGKPLTSVDRNYWGITFGSDDTTFYATAASGNTTWLVRGTLAARTLTAVTENAECPSLSPDGTHVAYKKRVGSGPVAHWAIAVFDLASGTETVLSEKRSVDDQVEWLDDSTLLYGLLSTETPGDSDIWSIGTNVDAKPAKFIEHAWSPSVVRAEDK